MFYDETLTSENDYRNESIVHG